MGSNFKNLIPLSPIYALFLLEEEEYKKLNDENDELCDELDEKDVTIKNLEKEVQQVQDCFDEFVTATDCKVKTNVINEALQVELYEELNKKDTVIRNLERKLELRSIQRGQEVKSELKNEVIANILDSPILEEAVFYFPLIPTNDFTIKKEVKTEEFNGEMCHKLDESDAAIAQVEAENARLARLVTAMKKEQELAQQLLDSWRQLWYSSRKAVEKRVTTPTKLRWDKLAIQHMVAEINKIEARYSPARSARQANDSSHNVELDAEMDKQRKEIADMVENVETHATKYSVKNARYKSKQVSNDFNPRKRMKKPSIVPKVFSTMWRLLLAPDERSPAKSLPSQPTYPIVDWQALARPTFRDKVGLPDPVCLPIHSCSQDPSFYQPSLDGGLSRTVEPAFEGKHPFGWITGYMTSMGPVQKPSTPINGYILGEDDQWTIAAYPPGGTPGTRRGRR